MLILLITNASSLIIYNLCMLRTYNSTGGLSDYTYIRYNYRQLEKSVMRKLNVNSDGKYVSLLIKSSKVVQHSSLGIQSIEHAPGSLTLVAYAFI